MEPKQTANRADDLNPDGNKNNNNNNQRQLRRRPKRDSAPSRPTKAPPTPPDGGWGWVVVLSSFMISVFVDGVCFSVGVFFNSFRDAFGTSKAETAWVGSVLNGSYLTVGE